MAASSNIVNIGRGNDDAFYRYKMPKLACHVEGRGNGVKTVIDNMIEIAIALDRPASYTTKFFGCELGAQCKFDDKAAKASVNGTFDSSKLQSTLDLFIKRFVLCARCQNPETKIIIDKRENMSLECKACGHVTPIDPREKLCVYILKHPPEAASGATVSSAAKKYAEAEKRQAEIAASASAGKPEKKGKKGKKDDSDDDIEWGEDASEDAARRRREAIFGSASTREAAAEKAKNIFTNAAADKTDGDIIRELGEIKRSSGLTDDAFASVVFAAAIPESKDALSKSKRLAGVLKVVAASPIARRALINGYVELFGNSGNAAAVAAAGEGAPSSATPVAAWFKVVPVVLKALYDVDALEEEDILAWEAASPASGQEAAFAAARTACAPLIDWLKTADEEEEDDE